MKKRLLKIFKSLFSLKQTKLILCGVLVLTSILGGVLFSHRFGKDFASDLRGNVAQLQADCAASNSTTDKLSNLQDLLSWVKNEIVNNSACKILEGGAENSWEKILFQPTYNLVQGLVKGFNHTTPHQLIQAVLNLIDELCDEFGRPDDACFDIEVWRQAYMWRESIFNIVESALPKIFSIPSSGRKSVQRHRSAPLARQPNKLPVSLKSKRENPTPDSSVLGQYPFTAAHQPPSDDSGAGFSPHQGSGKSYNGFGRGGSDSYGKSYGDRYGRGNGGYSPDSSGSGTKDNDQSRSDLSKDNSSGSSKTNGPFYQQPSDDSSVGDDNLNVSNGAVGSDQPKRGMSEAMAQFKELERMTHERMGSASEYKHNEQIRLVTNRRNR